MTFRTLELGYMLRSGAENIKTSNLATIYYVNALHVCAMWPRWGGECVKQPGCRVCFCVLPCPLQPRAVQPNTAVFLPTWVYERYTNPSLRTSPFISMQFRTRCESKEFHCTPRCCSGYMMCEHMSTVSSVKKFLLCRKPEIEMWLLIGPTWFCLDSKAL